METGRINHKDEAFSIAVNPDRTVPSAQLYRDESQAPMRYYLLKWQTDKKHRRAMCEIADYK